MPTLISSSPAQVYFDGKLVGTAISSFEPLPTAQPEEFEFKTSYSASFTMKLPKGQARALKELVDPALKYLHHYLQVKQAERKRQLQRKRQGRS
jgi:hypothetical protein